MDCQLCVKANEAQLEAQGVVVKARLTAIAAIKSYNTTGTSSISVTATRERTQKLSISAEANIYDFRSTTNVLFRREAPKLQADVHLGGNLSDDHYTQLLEGAMSIADATRYGSPINVSGIASIKQRMTLNANIGEPIVVSGILSVPYTDRFAGDFPDYSCVQKQYPISDISSQNFVDKRNKTANLYQSIDEGIYTGNYQTDGLISDRIGDEAGTYIQPSSIQTEGNYSYKCGITRPTINGKHSRVIFRAAAPLANYDSDAPTVSTYTISGIKIEDPDGQLIAEYKDIVVRGDADYDDPNGYVNFATYSTAPLVNKLELYEWESGYPNMESSTGYSLSFSVVAESFDDPFDIGFDFGFEENTDVYETHAGDNDYLALDGAPMSTQTPGVHLNPSNAIRISAIEICNSGSMFGLLKEHFLPLSVQVRPSGDSLERRLKPVTFMSNTFDSGIYPMASSIWELPANTAITNETSNGRDWLKNNLNYLDDDYYINLKSLDSEHLADSGKLMLKFGLENPDEVLFTRRGEFGFGHAKTEFKVGDMQQVDCFFTVTRATLRIRARKSSAGIRDYSLDVVGWSDDKLLNVTSAVGGFLQNEEGTGVGVPVSSGMDTTDHLALAGESFSDKDQFYSGILPNNAGQDHYKLATTPVVTGTSFQWYEVPLRVYEDRVDIGKSKDYTMSSYFEHLYMDIYPLPTGAQISHIELCLKYSPSNAMNLHTVGSENIGMITSERSEGRISPTSRQSTDSVINAGSGFAPISKIEGIPHAFTTPTTIKANYARRWKGHNGLVQGPFDPMAYGFGLENPSLDYPFVSGFFNFTNINGSTLKSEPLGPNLPTVEGTISTTYSNHIYKNVGWRFKDQDIFLDDKPGWSSDYKTTDWTALSNGAQNYQQHELYGNIADAFDTAIRISGHNTNVNFGALNLADAFAAYVRFAPDISVSGAFHNGFSSGVVLSKWDAGKGLEFALGYDDGYLCGFASTPDGTVVKAKDTVPYSGYQYPLSTILTYNDNGSQKLRLYADNETSGYWNHGNWNTLRATSDSFTRNTGTSNLVLGFSPGSGVGMNVFVSEFGISNSGTVVYSDAELINKEVTAEQFLENTRVKFWQPNESYSNDSYKLWDRINESTLDWDLGAFQHDQFNPDFNAWTKRSGRDYVTFSLTHAGSGYYPYATKTMPTNVASGVAYHTQIENDFLRFNLSDSADNFHSIAPRISKSLPRGYDFSERAMVVESVINHHSDQTLTWPDGEIGPKLIVSLYTKNQEPYSYATTNYGLVNRSMHYLGSGSIHRLDSKFDFNNFTDNSEQWALFPYERRLTEFDHKYYSKDIDKMFLQYDIAYPSGEAFESRLDLHSAHIRLDNAFVTKTTNSGTLPISVSGQRVARGELSLHTVSLASISNLSGIVGGEFVDFNHGLSLFTKYNPITVGSGLALSTSGTDFARGTLPLSIKNVGTGIASFNLYASGGLSVSEGKMPLFAYNDVPATFTSGELPMFTFGDSGISAAQSTLQVSILGTPEVDKGTSTANVALYTQGFSYPTSRWSNGYMNLFLGGKQSPSGTMNLHTYSKSPFLEPIDTSGTFSLHTISTRLEAGPARFFWTSDNFGRGIEVDDNKENLFAKADSDEIRGVDLVCFGNCTNSGCYERAIVTHDTTWFDPECVDGGIFRAKATYTNLDYSYSGDFYGLRKFVGLSPDTRYDITITGKTGNDKGLVPPREWEEWEYGTNEQIAYSGQKLIGDYPSAPSGRDGGELNYYGKTTKVKKDLMMVSAPNHEYNDLGSGILPDAGAVFAYRRQPTVDTGDKYFWDFEQKIVIPSGHREDNFEIKGQVSFFEGVDPIPLRKWHVGQRGRQFGHSMDVASSGGREIAVVGAPNASFIRDFDSDVSTRTVPILLVVVTDEYKVKDERAGFGQEASEGKKRNHYHIYETIRRFNDLYKYYAETPAKLEMKLLVCDAPPHSDVDGTEGFLVTSKIDRNGTQVTDSEVFTGLQDAFLKAYPYDTTKAFNNIPVMMGLFVDPTPSFTREAVEPAIDTFVQYYKDYGAVSGVTDVNGTVDSGHFYEHFVTGSEDNPEDWIEMSEKLVESLLDTGRLITDDGMRFITTEIGSQHANVGLEAFNRVPDSGGRAYIFEKESGHWNLIQEIKSPTETELHAPDRFGHAVAISENSEVVTIGSPYIANACVIFEYDSSVKDKMYNKVYSWITNDDNNVRLLDEINKFNAIEQASGNRAAKETIYNELTPTDKFQLRKDNKIEEYKPIYQYSYDDVQTLGTWGFIKERAVATSRLGWSTAVNEDGSIVAFGAPTDSLNELDDINLYYRRGGMYNYGLGNPPVNWEASDGWATSTYAGAVRVFQSRKYFPHSGVVEYFKFGNLDMNSKPNGKYDTIAKSFEERTFTRTEFSDVEIPKDAGLAFVITPEVDAASDEIIQNIKDWMSLGDRTLVLVGNDPVWEQGGIYKRSNDVINKILSKLGSRMRLHAARNEYESLPDCASSGIENLTKSRDIKYQRATDIVKGDFYAKGVADIRIHIPDWKEVLGNDGKAYSYSCDKHNDHCLIPMQHDGDLRAQKKLRCYSECGDPKSETDEFINWPFHFGNGSASCCPTINQAIRKPFTEPAAVLAAAEWSKPKTIVIPSWTEEKFVPITKKKITKKNTEKTTYTFQESHLPNTVFSFSSDGMTGGTLGIKNYIDPPVYLGRDAIRQGVGSTKTLIKSNSKKAADESVYVAQQNVGTSKVIMIAGLEPERKENMLAGGDDNVLFYLNLVRKECPHTEAKIMQLGGWTGRTSFASAYDKSHLKEFYEQRNINVYENYTDSLYSTNNVCWIANANATIPQANADQINAWLSKGNKTLVITYDATQDKAQIVDDMATKLKLSMSPLYLNGKSKFANAGKDFFQGSFDQKIASTTSSKVLSGCGSNQNVKNFFVSYDEYSGVTSKDTQDFTPIKLTGSAFKLMHYPVSIGDKVYSSDTFWQIKPGVAEASVSTVANSGYRIFFSWVSEDGTENNPIRLISNNISESPDPRIDLFDSPPIYDYDKDDNPFEAIKNPQFIKSLERTGKGDVQSGHIDVRAPQLGMSWFIDGNNLRAGDPADIPYIPKTIRIVSVSGAMLPIDKETKVTTKEVEEEVVIGHKKVVTVHPEVRITIPSAIREIQTVSDKYCDLEADEAAQKAVNDSFGAISSPNEDGSNNSFMADMGQPDTADSLSSTTSQDQPVCDGSLVGDGPVVVAEEPESFSSFLSGRSRSRIVLISDASIVQQGLCGDHYEENSAFINSLYPKSLDAFNNSTVADVTDNGTFSNSSEGAGTSETDNSNAIKLVNSKGGRQFSFTQKIISPERGSPQKFYSASGLDNLRSRFGDNMGDYRLSSGTFFGYDGVNPTTVSRPPAPTKESERKGEVSKFEGRTSSYAGAFHMISGVKNNTKHMDALDGKMPWLLAESGIDYLDTEYWGSGYPGDLFGLSLALDGKRLVVGSPYNGYDTESATSWDLSAHYDMQDNASGLKLSGKGGAGAVFVYENNNNGVSLYGKPDAWGLITKLKPTGSIDVGFDGHGNLGSLSEFSSHHGNSDYTLTDIANMARTTDQFGQSVDIESDFIVVGAPGHNFENHYENIYDNGAFIRKEFNAEYDIPTHTVFDLGASGLRGYELSGSGEVVLNNGAVYTFEHRVKDWSRMIKEWTFAEKIVPQGHKSRLQKTYDGIIPVSGAENDAFGTSVSLHRSRRSDSDYTLAVGAPNHMFASSGNPAHSPEIVERAGAAYAYDAMLREQPPQSGSPNSFIDATVFGASGYNTVNLVVEQTAANKEFTASGQVYSNAQGEIFIEASGRDPATMGFIQHRPYIKSVVGTHPSGEISFASLPLYADGGFLTSTGSMNMYLDGPSSAMVYNTMSMHTVSRTKASGHMNLTTVGVAGTTIGSGMALSTSGTFLTTEQVNLYTRGK